jgi:hypothetical protein
MARIAVHLEAGRFDLAERMADRHSASDHTRAEAWAALRVLIGQHRGNGDEASDQTRRCLALHFPSLRRLWSSGADAQQRATCTKSA